MDAVVLRGRWWSIAWVMLLLILIVATRLSVVLIAINGREELPSQLLADAIAVALVLYIVSGDRVAKWLGVLLFAVWGLVSLGIAISDGGAVTFSLRGQIVVLLAVGAWGVVVQALAVLTGVACLGFAVMLAVSPSINRYLASRRGSHA